MLTFEQLLAFRAIIRAGSFSRAADELFLTQPAVSQRIRQLEQALGTELLRRDRNRRAIRPTPAGDRVLQFADDMVVGLQRLHQDIRNTNDVDERKAVSLASSSTPAKYILPSLLAVYYERCPQARVHVVHGAGPAINTAVHSGELDLAIQVAALVDDRLNVIPLASDRLVVVAAPREAALVGPRGWLARMGRCPFVVTMPADGYIRQIAEAWAASCELRLDVVMEAGDMELLKEAVVRGLGLAVASEWAVAREVADGQLAILAVPGMPHELQFCLVSEARRHPSAAVQAFLDVARGNEWRTYLPATWGP